MFQKWGFWNVAECLLCGTNRPDARAAIADAAFFRSCGNFYAAMQPASWKRPFKATISVNSKPTFRRDMFELTHPRLCRHLSETVGFTIFPRNLPFGRSANCAINGHSSNV